TRGPARAHVGPSVGTGGEPMPHSARREEKVGTAAADSWLTWRGPRPYCREHSHEATGEEASARHPLVPLAELPVALGDDLERDADLLGARRLHQDPRRVCGAVPYRLPPGGRDGMALHVRLAVRAERPGLRALHRLLRRVALSRPQPSLLARGDPRDPA